MDNLEGRTLRQRWARFTQLLPARIRTFGNDWLGWIGVLFVFVWEVRNSTLGFVRLFNPGLFLAVVIGAGATMLALYFTRQAMEHGRARRTVQATTSALVALIAAMTILVGVWSNLAVTSIELGGEAQAARANREAVAARIMSLQSELNATAEPLGVETMRASLEKIETIGRQFNLPDLSSTKGGDCDRDLAAYPRHLCNQASDLRGQLALMDELIARRADLQRQIATEQEKLASAAQAESTAHFEQMAAVLDRDNITWETIATFVTLFLSMAFLVIAAFGFDTLMERRERRSSVSV